MKSLLLLSWIITGIIFIYGMESFPNQAIWAILYIHGFSAGVFLTLHFRTVFSFCESCGETDIIDSSKICRGCNGTGINA